MVGAFVFLTGLLQLALAQTVVISVRAGILMISSFVMISTSVIGFYGSYDENFCLIITYGIFQLTFFFLRLVTAMVKIRIKFMKKNVPTDDEMATIEFLMITDIISGLPGSTFISLQLIYAIFELILGSFSLYIFFTINTSMNKKLERELMDSDDQIDLLNGGDVYLNHRRNHPRNIRNTRQRVISRHVNQNQPNNNNYSNQYVQTSDNLLYDNQFNQHAMYQQHDNPYTQTHHMLAIDNKPHNVTLVPNVQRLAIEPAPSLPNMMSGAIIRGPSARIMPTTVVSIGPSHHPRDMMFI